MYPYSTCFGLEVVLRRALQGQSIYYMVTWTLKERVSHLELQPEKRRHPRLRPGALVRRGADHVVSSGGRVSAGGVLRALLSGLCGMLSRAQKS